MNDKFIRKYSHELPESVVSSCPEFADAAPGNGRGANGQRAKGKGQIITSVIVPVSIAALVLAGVIAGLITASYMKHRRTDEPDISISGHTPDTTVPAATDEIAPSILPTIAPTAEPTAAPTSTPTLEPTETPEPTATPESTGTPTAIPTATPLYPEPEATKFYQFSGYDEIAGMLCESSYGIYQLLREDNKDEYGAQYARLLKLFADGTIRPAAPFVDGERMRTSLIGHLYTNGTFNLPWIEYKCVTGETYEQYRYYDIRFTYLDLIEGHDLSRSSIAEVIAVLDPGIPLPAGSNVTKTAEYIAIRNVRLTLKDGEVDAIRFARKDGEATVLDYMFLQNGCIVSVTPHGKAPAEELFAALSTGTYTADLSKLAIPPAAVPRSSDPSRITRAEAKQLIRDAVNFLNSADGYFEWFEGGSESIVGHNFHIIVEETHPLLGTIEQYYRPVIDGYDEAGVRVLVNNTFMPELAARYTGADAVLSGYLISESGRVYYRQQRAQISYYRPYSITEEELDGLVLDEQAGTGWLRTQFHGMYVDDNRDREVVISVRFAWDNGWKLADIDTADAALCEYASGFAAESFSVDNARRIIRTVLGDLYMWTHVGSEHLPEMALIDDAPAGTPAYLYRGALKLNRVPGTMSAPWIWRGYAERFLTEPLADRMLTGGIALMFSGDYAYYYENAGFEQNDFRYEYFDREELEVLNVSATKATVRLTGWNYCLQRSERSGIIVNDDMMALDFEFELVDGVWKISGGNFFDRLDAVYAEESILPYPADTDPSLAPPAPDRYILDLYEQMFVPRYQNAFNITTYNEVHLKPGEALKIPVFWYRDEPLPEGAYELSVEFESSDNVRFELISKDEAPGCELCFVATALKPGQATVRLYGSYDPDKLSTEDVKSLSDNGRREDNLLIDAVVTVYVD